MYKEKSAKHNFVEYLSLSSTLKLAPPNPESTKFHTIITKN